eukprot:scaffold12401_cov133-Isochrysis_galbana.AAC.6
MACHQHKPRGRAAVGLSGRVAGGVRSPVHTQPAQLVALSHGLFVVLVPRPRLTPPSRQG